MNQQQFRFVFSLWMLFPVFLFGQSYFNSESNDAFILTTLDSTVMQVNDTQVICIRQFLPMRHPRRVGYTDVTVSYFFRADSKVTVFTCVNSLMPKIAYWDTLQTKKWVWWNEQQILVKEKKTTTAYKQYFTEYYGAYNRPDSMIDSVHIIRTITPHEVTDSMIDYDTYNYGKSGKETDSTISYYERLFWYDEQGRLVKVKTINGVNRREYLEDWWTISYLKNTSKLRKWILAYGRKHLRNDKTKYREKGNYMLPDRGCGTHLQTR